MATSNFSAIETFYWVSRLQSFHGAADFLHVTQPTVSYRVRELEETLGVQLFVRHGRKIQLTSDGSALLGYAEKMVSIAQDIEANIKIGGNASRSLRLGTTDSFANICLPEFLDEIETIFPSMRVSINIDHSHALTQKLSLGELDMSVLSTPPSLPGIELSPLGGQSVVWTASPKLGFDDRAVTIAALLGQRIFTTPAPSNLHSLTTDLLGNAADTVLRLSVCNSVTIILNLVRAGLGISLLPRCLVEPDLEAGRLQMINATVLPPPQDVFIGWNKGIINRSRPRIAHLIAKVAHAHHYCALSDKSSPP